MKLTLFFAVPGITALMLPVAVTLGARATPKGTTPLDTTRQLGALLAKSQTRLEEVEKQRDNGVKALRGRVSTILDGEARTLGAQVRRYSLELEQAADVLARSVNSTLQDLSRSSNNSVHDIMQEMAMERRQASLKAEANVAERVLHQIEQHSEGLVREASSHAQQVLIDATDELSLPLGDMSSESEASKATLRSAASTAHADAKTDVATTSGAVTGSSSNEQPLAAEAHAHSLLTAAENRFNAMLANETKMVHSKVQSVRHDLEVEKEHELQMLHDAKNLA